MQKMFRHIHRPSHGVGTGIGTGIGTDTRYPRCFDNGGLLHARGMCNVCVRGGGTNHTQQARVRLPTLMDLRMSPCMLRDWHVT